MFAHLLQLLQRLSNLCRICTPLLRSALHMVYKVSIRHVHPFLCECVSSIAVTPEAFGRLHSLSGDGAEAVPSTEVEKHLKKLQVVYKWTYYIWLFVVSFCKVLGQLLITYSNQDLPNFSSVIYLQPFNNFNNELSLFKKKTVLTKHFHNLSEDGDHTCML